MSAPLQTYAVCPTCGSRVPQMVFPDGNWAWLPRDAEAEERAISELVDRRTAGTEWHLRICTQCGSEVFTPDVSLSYVCAFCEALPEFGQQSES